MTNEKKIAQLTAELAEAREETRRYAQVADNEKRDRVEMRRLLDAERAAHERTKIERWPQTVATLEAALKTFPAGRVFLSQWTKANRERDAAQAETAEIHAAIERAGRALVTRIPLLEVVAKKAQHLCDDAYETEDHQSMVVDPGFWRELRDAVRALT